MALESVQLRADTKDVLLGASKLWGGLREKAAEDGQRVERGGRICGLGRGTPEAVRPTLSTD